MSDKKPFEANRLDLLELHANLVDGEVEYFFVEVDISTPEKKLAWEKSQEKMRKEIQQQREYVRECSKVDRSRLSLTYVG